MGRFWKYFVILLGLILCGCQRTPQAPVSHLVTGVDIACQKEDVLISRHYTRSPKMEYVILYLRLLEPVGTPEINPEILTDPVYCITVHFSDGSQQVYRQKDHRYLSVDGGPWQSIDPGQAAGLYRLMEKLPSDRL